MIFYVNGLKNKTFKLNETKESDFTALAKYTPSVVPQEMDIKYYKDNTASYFFSGELKANEQGEYIRNNSNVISRSLIVIDIDDYKGTVTSITDKLKDYKYLIYETINSTASNRRFRIILEPTKPITKPKTYKATIKHITDTIGIKYDGSSGTWSQLQGLPVCRQDNKKDYIFIKKLDGKQVEVVEAVDKKTTYNNNTVTETMFDEAVLLSLFERYVELDFNNLSEYDNYISVMHSIALSVHLGQITVDTAYLCCELLACGKDEWIIGNRKDLKNLLKKPVEEFITTYTIIDKMKTIKDKELNFYIDWKILNKPPKSDKELKKRLFKIGLEWREENTKVNEKTGEETTPIMRFNTVAKFLKDNLPIVLIGENKDNALLSFYSYSNGIYLSSQTELENYIQSLEYRMKPSNYKEVLNYLKPQVELVQLLQDRFLIPCNNGIFDLKRKTLKPFNPRYIITAKIVTDYNENAKVNPVVEVGFDIEQWFSIIANYDEEVKRLLFEIINECCNPNHTRNKIGIIIGSGNNGKGTLQQLITNIIGSKNISNLHPKHFEAEFYNNQLIGKVCNIGDDVSSKYLESSSTLQSIATGDPITINRKNKNPIETSLKLFSLFSMNKIPKINNTTDGLYRRLLIIPFLADFNGVKEDPRIKNEFMNDKRIKEYVLYKALNMDFEKFTEPKIVKDMLKQYKADNDYLYSFLQDVYVENNLHEMDRIPVPIIKELFVDYLFNEKLDKQITRTFGNDIAEYLTKDYKEKGYSYKVVKKRLRGEDKRILKNKLSSLFRNSQFYKNTLEKNRNLWLLEKSTH